MPEDYIFIPGVKITTPMQFTEAGAHYMSTQADDTKFTMRDLGLAVMQAQNHHDELVRVAYRQLAHDLQALHARAVAAGLIKEGEPLPSEYLLSAPE